MPLTGLSTAPLSQPTPEVVPAQVPQIGLVQGRPLLELNEVTKRFGRVTVAEGLSLRVADNELLGVVGPNGAGKTSLFSIISGDLAPDRGDVMLAGRRVNNLDPAARCRLGIGRTYQVPRPFEQMTVFENVLLAAHTGAGLRRRAAEQYAYGVLEETGLARDVNRPAGVLGLLPRKRLEFARALATRPRLLLLDEVAAGLTDPEVAELVDLVKQARAGGEGRPGMAVVWVEHVVRALVATVERLICLDSGAIIADGAPGQVLADSRVRQVYLGTEEEIGEEVGGRHSGERGTGAGAGGTTRAEEP